MERGGADLQRFTARWKRVHTASGKRQEVYASVLIPKAGPHLPGDTEESGVVQPLVHGLGSREKLPESGACIIFPEMVNLWVWE